MSNLINERISKFHLFRAYDIRGVYPEQIDSQMMFEVGIIVSHLMQKELGHSPKIFVGFDIRKTSSLLAYSIAAGMTAGGGIVFFSGEPFPFGVVLYSGYSINVDFTAFITASHLPPEWNGVKFYYGDGVGFPEEKIKNIRDAYIQNFYKGVIQNIKWNKISLIKQIHCRIEYFNFLISNFKLDHPLKLIIDCGNGSASLIAPDIFEKCNYDSKLLWCNVDPMFPNRSAEPTPKSLITLSNLVKKHQASFGVGFDGDGDRAVIVDDEGHILSAEEIGIIVAKYILAQKNIKNPLVLANIACSSILEETLSDKCDILRIKVGHTFLTLEAKNRKDSCILGIESSGHFVFPKYFFFDDALLLPLIVGKIIQNGKKLSTLIKSLPKLSTSEEVFKTKDETKFEIIKKLIEKYKLKYPQIDTIDGLSISFKNGGRILVRASNTGPKIRFSVEASEKKRLNEIIKEFKPVIEDIIRIDGKIIS